MLQSPLALKRWGLHITWFQVRFPAAAAAAAEGMAWRRRAQRLLPFHPISYEYSIPKAKQTLLSTLAVVSWARNTHAYVEANSGGTARHNDQQPPRVRDGAWSPVYKSVLRCKAAYLHRRTTTDTRPWEMGDIHVTTPTRLADTHGT